MLICVLSLTPYLESGRRPGVTRLFAFGLTGSKGRLRHQAPGSWCRDRPTL